MSADAIGQRTRSALVFLGAKGGLTYAVRLGRLAILARLLAPEAFGVFALALILVRAFEVLTGFGAERYLIQKEQIDDSLVASAFAFNALRGIAVGAAVWLGAPLYASIMGAPQAADIVRIIAIVPLLNGLTNPQRYLAERGLRFGRIVAYESVSVVVDASITVGLALVLRDVTALAWGFAAAGLVNAVLSYLLFSMPKRLRPTKESFGEILGVGRYFVSLSVGSFVMTQGDNLMVGALLGSTALGYYVLAYKLAELPMQVFGKITNRVALPMFSRVQDQESRRRSLLTKWVSSQLILLLPVVGAYAVFSSLLVTVIYGPTWAPAAPVLSVLALVTLGRGFSLMVAPYLLSVSRFAFSARVKGVEASVFLVGVWLGARQLGMEGAALGAGAGYSLAAAIRIGHLVRHGDLHLGSLVATASKGTFATALALASGWWVSRIETAHPMWDLALVGGVSALVWIAVATLVHRREFRGMMNFARTGKG